MSGIATVSRSIAPAARSTGSGESEFGIYLSLMQAADSTYDPWWAARLADPGVASLMRPSNGNTVTDLTGNTTPGGLLTRASLPGGKGVVAYDNGSAGAPPYFVDDMTLRFICKSMAVTGGSNAFYLFDPGESEAENVLCQVFVNSSSDRIGYSHERDSGVNEDVVFQISTDLLGEAMYGSVCREDNGDGTCDVMCCLAFSDGTVTQLPVNSTSGTNNGNSATIPSPTGGTDATIREMMEGLSSFAWQYVQYLNATTTIEAEQSVLDALVALG